MRHTSAGGSGGHCGLNDEGACYVFFSAGGITDAVVEVAAMLLATATATEAAATVEALEPSATTFATGANCQSLIWMSG